MLQKLLSMRNGQLVLTLGEMSDFAVVQVLLTSIHSYCEASHAQLQAEDVKTIIYYIRKAIYSGGMSKKVEQYLIDTMVLLSKVDRADELLPQLETLVAELDTGRGTCTVRVILAATPRIDTVKFLSLNVALHSRQLQLASNDEFSSKHTVINDEPEVELPKECDEHIVYMYTREQILNLRQNSFIVPDFPAWSWIAGIVTLNIDTPPNTPTTTTSSCLKRW